MASIHFDRAVPPVGARPFPVALLAQQLKGLDRCARNSQGGQRAAAKQQIDAAWRHLLQGSQSAFEATYRGAEVASLMLGHCVPAADLHRARRAGAGTHMADPFPFAAASLYAFLDAWDIRDTTDAMEDAFANLSVASGAQAWCLQPPALGPRPTP